MTNVGHIDLFFTADVTACHCRKSTGVIDSIKNDCTAPRKASFRVLVLYLLAHCPGLLRHLMELDIVNKICLCFYCNEFQNVCSEKSLHLLVSLTSTWCSLSVCGLVLGISIRINLGSGHLTNLSPIFTLLLV